MDGEIRVRLGGGKKSHPLDLDGVSPVDFWQRVRDGSTAWLRVRQDSPGPEQWVRFEAISFVELRHASDASETKDTHLIDRARGRLS